jgi:hypothetical protein
MINKALIIASSSSNSLFPGKKQLLNDEKLMTKGPPLSGINIDIDIERIKRIPAH